MKIKQSKKRITIDNTPEKAINFSFALITILAISTFLIALFPSYWYISIILFLMFLDLKEKNVFNTESERIDITSNEIIFKKGRKTIKSYKRKDIDRIYIQESKGILEFYINYTDRISFHLSHIPNNQAIIDKLKALLNLKTTISQKTTSGELLKLESIESLSNKEQHLENAKIVNANSLISQSEFYEIKSLQDDIKINSTKNIGYKSNNSLTIDKESQSLKIFMSEYIPDEIFFDQIISLEVTITHNATGEKGDIVEGRIIANIENHGPSTIFRCNVKEEHQLDFTANKLNEDLIALKAMIEFEILSLIDNNLETLDLDTLKEDQDKLKNEIPNTNNLEY